LAQAAPFLTEARLAAARLAEAFLAETFLADAFLADAFLAEAFLAEAFLAEAFLAEAFLADWEGSFLGVAHLSAFLAAADFFCDLGMIYIGYFCFLDLVFFRWTLYFFVEHSNNLFLPLLIKMTPEFKTWVHGGLHMTTVKLTDQTMNPRDFSEFLAKLTGAYQPQQPYGLVYDLTGARYYSLSLPQIRELIHHLQALQKAGIELHNKVVIVVVGNRFLAQIAKTLVAQNCSADQQKKIGFCVSSLHVDHAIANCLIGG
jgi:hypothetical protein